MELWEKEAEYHINWMHCVYSKKDIPNTKCAKCGKKFNIWTDIDPRTGFTKHGWKPFCSKECKLIFHELEEEIRTSN